MPPPADLELHATLCSDPRYLQFVRTLAGEGADAAGFDEDTRGRIELAVVEGFTNVIRHAYKDRHDQPVTVRLTAAPGRLRVELEDRAIFVDPSKIASRPLEQVRPGGLGVHLMKTTMDVVEYRRNEFGGTTLVLEKARGAPEGADGRGGPR